MLFYSISVSAAQRLAVSFAITALTAQAEIRTMVNMCSDWCCLLEESIKYDNTLADFPQLGCRYTNRNSPLYAYK